MNDIKIGQTDDPVVKLFLSRSEKREQGFLQTHSAVDPMRATMEAAAYDICAYLPTGDLDLHPLEVVMVPTGIFMALPTHSAALICSRSGLASKGVQVINAPGIIDSDYRGEVKILLSYIKPPSSYDALSNVTTKTEPFKITHGMRVAQLLIIPPGMLMHPKFVGVKHPYDLPVTKSDRMGGFGSTGYGGLTGGLVDHG